MERIRSEPKRFSFIGLKLQSPVESAAQGTHSLGAILRIDPQKTSATARGKGIKFNSESQHCLEGILEQAFP